MTKEASEIRKKVENAKTELERANYALTQLEANCNHTWSEPKYTPIIRKPGWIEGDPPGFGGVDHRPGFYHSGSETPKWTRTCSTCGKTQETTSTSDEVIKHPKF